MAKRYTLTSRLSHGTEAALREAARLSGRSISQEAEFRLERSLIPTRSSQPADDLRTLIREEIRAALAEATRVVAPHAHTFRADFERRLSGSDMPLTGPEREAFLDGMEAVGVHSGIAPEHY